MSWTKALSMSLLLLLSVTGPIAAEPCQQPDNVTQMTGGKECLVIETYRGSGGGTAPGLFVLLHGNASKGSSNFSLYCGGGTRRAQCHRRRHDPTRLLR